MNHFIEFKIIFMAILFIQSVLSCMEFNNFQKEYKWSILEGGDAIVIQFH